jgi:regulation of enolase protein 1 (concanavalin A-like superfamily)
MRSKPLFSGLLVFASLLAGACGPGQAPAKPTPTPKPTPPVPPEAVRIEKATNVSFSTYSKEWPKGWAWIDPDEKRNPTPHNVDGGVLRVKVPPGKDMYGNSRTAPRYLKPITGDFQIETRVRINPTENYQGAGLLLYVDDENFLRFERAFGGVGGGGSGLRLDAQKGDQFEAITSTADIQTDLEEVDLKLIRVGDTYTAYWRADDGAEWREAGSHTADYPDTIRAGLIACNTAREYTVEFVYIKLLPAVGK